MFDKKYIDQLPDGEIDGEGYLPHKRPGFKTERITYNKLKAFLGIAPSGDGHTHANKNILDLITEAFTTGLKSTYDAVVTKVSNITSVGASGESEAYTVFDGQVISKLVSTETISLIGEGGGVIGFYDADNFTLSFLVPDGGLIQMNQEPHDYYHNLEGAQVVNGDIVSICGATGNRTAMCLTDITNDAKSLGCFGMVTVPTIGNNNVGRVTKSGGKVRDLNTDAYNEGDVLYVHPTLKGKWTATKPTSGRVIRIGVVSVKHTTVGVVELDIEVYPKPSELSSDNEYGTRLGTNALVSNNNGGLYDVAFGVDALRYRSSGGSSVAVGALAGKFIGSAANLTSCTGGVFIGYNSRPLTNNGINEIVIGYNAVGAGTNSVTLGNASITKTVLRGNVETNGSMKVGDDTVSASSANVGSLRYKVSGNNSY